MTTLPACRLRASRRALIPTMLALLSFANAAFAQHYEGCYINGQQVSDATCNGGASGGGGANNAMMGAAGSLGFAIGAGIGGAIRNMLLDNNNGAPTARQLNEQGIALFNQGRLQEAAELFRRSYNADHDGVVLANYYVTEGQIQYNAGNLDSARDFAMRAIRNGDGPVNVAKQELAVYDQAIAARNQAAAAQAQRQFAADEQGLLDEIRPIEATPAVAEAAPKPRSAADQLCAAAGEAAGCIGKFMPHGAAPSPGSSDPRAAQQAERQFTTALAALRTQPTAPPNAAAAADGKPCTVVTGFSVVRDQIRSDTAPCGAPAQSAATNSGDTDEAVSEAARVPFDTAVASAGSTPVLIANPNAKVPLFRPVVTYMTLDRESRQLKQDACVRLAGLERQLAGYRTALHRLASAGPMIADARAEWEQQLDKVTKEELGQLAGGLTSYLDARLDEKIEALNDEARRALGMRINVTNGDVRQQYDIAFRALVKQRKIVIWDHDTAVALLDLWSKGYDMLDLWNTNDRLDALRQLSKLLVSQPSFKAAAVPVTIVDLWINASGDLYAEWVHYKALTSLNQGAEQYTSGMTHLQKRIETTSKAIQKVRDEIASSKQACTAA